MKNLFLFIALLSLSSCTSPVADWIGKKITYPANQVFTRFAMDTLDYQIPESTYKILVYADSSGCTGCKLHLHKWKELMEQLDSVTQSNVPFLFYIQPQDKMEMQYLLRGNDFDYPVCVDTENLFGRLNKLPSDTILTVFLLDKNDQVLIHGNPCIDIDMKFLYFKQITGKEDVLPDKKQTTFQLSQSEIDFGHFPKSETRTAVVSIKNTGEHLLAVADVNTTCGCTVAIYDKRPVKSGDSIRLEIKIKPKSIGFFREVATVFTNAGNPVKIRIKGYAE